jgi:hypothetical protein
MMIPKKLDRDMTLEFTVPGGMSLKFWIEPVTIEREKKRDYSEVFYEPSTSLRYTLSTGQETSLTIHKKFNIPLQEVIESLRRNPGFMETLFSCVGLMAETLRPGTLIFLGNRIDSPGEIGQGILEILWSRGENEGEGERNEENLKYYVL